MNKDKLWKSERRSALQTHTNITERAQYCINYYARMQFAAEHKSPSGTLSGTLLPAS